MNEDPLCPTCGAYWQCDCAIDIGGGWKLRVYDDSAVKINPHDVRNYGAVFDTSSDTFFSLPDDTPLRVANWEEVRTLVNRHYGLDL